MITLDKQSIFLAIRMEFNKITDSISYFSRTVGAQNDLHRISLATG